MQYSDERIIPLKMDQREQQTPMSLEEGYFINGRLVKFIKMELFDKQLVVYLPENFIDMPEQICVLKYPFSPHPQIIKTDLTCHENFLFNILDNPEGLTGSEVANSFVVSLTRTNPSIKIGELTTEMIQADMEATFFEFICYGVDAQIYNLVSLIVSDSRIIQSTFNCPVQSKPEWEKVAKDVFLHIEVVS